MDNRLLVDGKEVDEVYLLQGRKKAPFHPVRRKITSNKSIHRLQQTTFDVLEITQPIGFKAPTKEEALAIQDRLAVWLITEDIVPIEFTDEPGRKYMAVMEGTMDDLDKRAILWEGSIRFICVETLGNDQSINLGTAYQAFTITGQKETNWISTTTFTSNQSTFQLACRESGLISLKYNFVQGDRLVIDRKFRTVKLNGKSLAHAILLETRWFMLQAGKINLKASQPTKMDYTETYY